MNLNPLTVAMAGTGGLLIYCGVYGYDPRDVVKGAIGVGDFPPEVKYALPKDSPSHALTNPDGTPRTLPDGSPDIPNIANEPHTPNPPRPDIVDV